MAVRRSPGKRDFPTVEFLYQWATSDPVWPFFDGWCASRNVDHLALPWDRWLNLVYYFATRNASKEDRDKFDTAIAEHVSAWYLKKARPVIEEARKQPQPKDGGRQRRLPPKPVGWGDDVSNTFNSKAAMTTMTSRGGSVRKRRS